MRLLFALCVGLLMASCSRSVPEGSEEMQETESPSVGQSADPQALPATFLPTHDGVELTVLGVVQDAGYPQLRCRKSCCVGAGKKEKKHVVSLGLIDNGTGRRWMFDAGPDFVAQVGRLDEIWPVPTENNFLAGIFLTHAHIGHYTGLMHLGREAMGASNIPVYAMPRMDAFLRKNGPWSQLVDLKNISLRGMQDEVPVQLTDSLAVTPLRVPHRDEFSETVGFRIVGPRAAALFIPDIDKWEKWDRNIADEIARVDYAFLDATFFANGEIPGRDMSEIPHPFVEESMGLLADLPAAERKKVFFIHFNHTNPLLQGEESPASEQVRSAGFSIAREGMTFAL